jgi:hypothetical protein
MALLFYPASFPEPLLAEYSYAVDAGVIRTAMESGDIRQRRRYDNMPHVFALSFAVKKKDLDSWFKWINENAYNWFAMRMVTWLTGTTDDCATGTLIRFISDIQVTPLTADVLKCSVSAEMLTVPLFVTPPDSGDWIIGQQPANPATDWIIGRTPANPAPIFTAPGTPAAPAGVV